jgi:serine protease Do
MEVIKMFENNSYEIKNENTAKHSGAKGGKILAMLLSMVIIGGGAGYGGAYLASQNAPAAAVSVTNNGDSGNSRDLARETNSDEANTPIFTQLDTAGVSSGFGTDASEMFAKVTPSVTLITSDFGDVGSSSGTGIIMSSDGYIITNAHVLQAEAPVYGQNSSPFGFGFGFGGSYTTELIEAEKVIVTLSDDEKTEYEAEIIGLDTTTDLAVIKIDATGLTAANIGDSEILKLGEDCYTLGYPLGIGLSASDGIISGLDREIGIEMNNGKAQNIPLLQITAAINPGNSGGPLLDSEGNVIGITSSKLASSSIEGLGFAIPITTAMPIINELMNTGTYQSPIPKIGITGQDMSATYARYYGLPVEDGVLVTSVEEGSSAAVAGIRQGDVIVSADGKKVATMEELNEIKNKHKAGETMTMGLARDGGETEVTLTLGSDN